MSLISLEVPRAFVPLLKPARYKGAHGGRGGAKSHFFAEQLVIRCFSRLTRAVCIREVQNSIKDSVKQLLVDKIAKLGLEAYFEVLETEIRGRNGSLIIFRGMQSYNADTIKSLEGYDIAWIEEAQTLSEHSFELLRPTIRKPDSEIWASWNPRHRTDAIDAFFRGRHKHPDAVCVEVNYSDNPWFPEVLRKEMARDREADPEGAEHIWDGGYGMQHGAILARWVDRAERAGRLASADYVADGPPIEISSDIGRRDTATWWFWQRRIGGYAVIDYDQGSGPDADEWCDRLHKRLTERGWPLGKIWLPHDARNKTFAAKYSAVEIFIGRFGAARLGVVPVSHTSDRINAARVILPKCEFNAARCELGIEGLRAWSYEWNPDLKVFSKEPQHDWACFIAGTRVATPIGHRPIEAIAPGDLVTTPAGPRMVAARYRYDASRLVEIVTGDGRRVTCTPNHNLFTSRGLIAADALTYSDVLFTGEEWRWRLIAWISRGVGIIGTHRAITDLCPPENRSRPGSKARRFIAICGSRLTGLFRTAAKFITATATRAITRSPISNACPSPITSACMGLKADADLPLGISQTPAAHSIPRSPSANGETIEAQSWPQPRRLSAWPVTQPGHGMPVPRDGNGIRTTPSVNGRLGRLRLAIARCAVRALLRCPGAPNTAGRIVALRPFAVAAPVYDLTVDGEHCFIAGGILSSNSHPADGFSYGCQVMQTVPPPEAKRETPAIGIGPHAQSTVTFDELWAPERRR